MSTSVMWFRRDLRLRDNPALRAAAVSAEEVLGLFVLDPTLWRSAGPARRAWLAACLRSLDESMGGRLVLRLGDPRTLVASYAAEAGVKQVHVTGETTPYGTARDETVEQALGRHGLELVRTGTPYAVAPGTVKNGSGDPYKVFTPFSRAWREIGYDAPSQAPRGITWVFAESDQRVEAMLDTALEEVACELPTAGEDAAVRRWKSFLGDIDAYDDERDHPAVDGTSRLSPYLKYGVVHPRQMLADLGERRSAGAHTWETEIAWRDFYGDVLHQQPRTTWEDLKTVPGMTYDDPADDVDAWREGRTGFPIVDAGMRQLLHEGWMHNRVRMITASFLTKDLHVWWPVGARHFLDHLVDGDIASNNHGWQWVAGTGTDASPYFRVFNPITQGQKFDPQGDYVRRWLPQLRHLEGKKAHTPWEADGGYDHDYPRRIVDHAEERLESLRRYQS